MSVLTTPLKVLSVPSVAKHTATVIFVHVRTCCPRERVNNADHRGILVKGLGDTGYGWQPVADMLKLNPELQHVKWVLPHA
jgi:lysophospholipase-1